MRVLVVDDSVLIRAGLGRLLAVGGHTVPSVADADAARAAVRLAVPDVAIVDIKLPPTFTDEGLRLARELRDGGIPVLVLSQYAVTAYATTLLAAGPAGCGYLLKERLLDAEQLHTALRRLCAGGTVVDPALADSVAAAARRLCTVDRLTQRELEILALLTQGFSDRGIAEHLVISVHTVGSHVQRIFRKLGVPGGVADNRRVLAALSYLESS